MTMPRIENYTTHDITDTEPKESLKIENYELKNIYEKYQNMTNGTPEKLGMFQNLTSVTKSKYENVVGWIRSKK